MRIATKGRSRCSNTELAITRSKTPFGSTLAIVWASACHQRTAAGLAAVASPPRMGSGLLYGARPNGCAYTSTSTSLHSPLKMEPPYQPSQSRQRPRGGLLPALPSTYCHM